MINMIRNKSNLLPGILLLCIIMLVYSCKKIDMEKLHEERETVNTIEEARILLKETYDLIKGVNGIEINGDSAKNFYPYLLLTTALYSDEAIFNGSNSSWQQFEDRNIMQDNPVIANIWFTGYKIIDKANILIADVESFESSDERDNLLGQAKAIWHIPLVSNPIMPGEYLPAVSQSELYDFIIEDLHYSIDMLPGIDTSDNTIFNRDAAKALLARIYLYTEQWQEALTYAEDIINSGNYSLCTQYGEAFINNENFEIIWKLDYDINNKNNLGYYCYPVESGGVFEYAPHNAQISAFEESDTRKDYCISSNSTDFISKYRNPASGDFDIPVIRYSEVLLIAAESANMMGNQTEALAYLNLVRTRAGIAPLTSVTPDDILHERQCELAFEGHRWFDINRLDKAAEIIGPLDADFSETNELWPVPQQAINENPNLIQNPGY
jgi:hypothetical protein